MPLEDFLNQVMKNVVGVLAHNIGWHAAQTATVDILADLTKKYLLHLAKATHNYGEHFGRTSANLNDAALALRDLGVNISELEEYIQNFDPVLLQYSHRVPEIPLKKESKLNFLRPGSEEVLTRAMHVHEYMPPMIFVKKKPKEEVAKEEAPPLAEEIVGESQVEEPATSSSNEGLSVGKTEEVIVAEPIREPSPEKEVIPEVVSNGVVKMDIDPDEEDSSEDEIEALENGGTASRKFTPFSGLSKTNKRENVGDNPALKRVRMMLAEEGHPLREISSAMMTSSGFLTSSREGRLPDTRPPPMSREFFEPLPPPPIEKKKKVITMKRIVEGVKKIEKEKENDDDDVEEPALFGNPDKIKISSSRPISVTDLKPQKGAAVVEVSSKEVTDVKKLKKLKKLKLDKKKLSKGIDRDKKKLKIFKKAQAQQMKAAADKALLKKSKKFQLKEFAKSPMKIPRAAAQESLDIIDSDDDFDMDGDGIIEHRLQPTVAPMIIKSSLVTKKKDLTPNPELLKVAKSKDKSLSPAPGSSTHLVPTPKSSPLLEGGSGKKVSPISLTTSPSLSPESQLKKKRGRPRKNTPLVLTPAALANLGRGLMQDKRQLKIKKSHMEPDVRSLIPEISMSTPTPPKANRPPPNLNLLPAAPGLIPTGFGGSPVKIPQHIPPSISITPATPSMPVNSPVKDKNPFGGPSSSLHGNVCSSITITPIDMPSAQKLPTPYDKTITPGIGSPAMQQARPNKPPKEKPSPPSNQMQMPIKTSSSSGITITPIVMKEDRFVNETVSVEAKIHHTAPLKMDKNSSVTGMKFDEDFKSKELRRKEKERRKELKKEKKKEKKEKEKLKDGKVKEDGKEKKDKKDKSEKKKEKKKEKLLGEGEVSSPPYVATVPKLTLKLSGHSGTPTPVDSPNPPPVTIGDYEPKVVPKVLPPPPPLTPAPKKIVFKPIEEHVKMRTPSPELARFSPLVTRAPKPGRAAKAHAAAAVAADAMGAYIGHQMVGFPPDIPGGPGSSKRGRKPGGGSVTGKPEKLDKSTKLPKVAPAVTTLVTETVGWFEDEHGNKIWICPTCGRQDDGSPMIGCDICDDWYHFTCVGITETPSEDSQWFCPRCEKKKHKKEKKK